MEERAQENNNSENDDASDDEFDEDDSNCDSVITFNEKRQHDTNISIKPETAICRRSIVIDYSKPKSQIYVLWPIVIVWLLAISISIPLFLFGRIIPSISRNSNERMCGIVQIDRSNSILLQFLLIKIRIIIPTFCLALSTIYVIYKLVMYKHRIVKLSTINNLIDEDAEQILKLALSLALTFIVCSMQRIFGSLWFELITRPMMEYKYAQFHRWLGVAGCMLHYIAVILRPMLYWRFEKILWIDLKRGWWCCCCNNSKPNTQNRIR